MARASEKRIGRREALKALGIAGLGCFGSLAGLKAALAQARAEGKQVLTERTLNRIIPDPAASAASKREFTAAMTEARTDLKGYLSKRFSLTPAQVREIESLTPAQKKDLNRVLDAAIKNNAKPTIEIGRSTRSARSKKKSKHVKVSAQGPKGGKFDAEFDISEEP